MEVYEGIYRYMEVHAGMGGLRPGEGNGVGEQQAGEVTLAELYHPEGGMIICVYTCIYIMKDVDAI